MLVDVARTLEAGGAQVRGIMTHAGGSYGLSAPDALRRAAENERASAVGCAEALRRVGHDVRVVSIGSTPTAVSMQSLDGVTEVRAGVFAFFDLVMAGIGVCAIDDIALSVVATVIGHQHERGLTIIDAGWMAMSRDRGTASQAIDQGYGMVCDLNGQPHTDFILTGANQEHGIASLRPGSSAAMPDLAVGARVRILPNHACATGAQHQAYYVVEEGGMEISAVWPRFSGW